jgi:hypothetical protein
MPTNPIQPSSYNGSKDYDQWQVHTANGTGFGAASRRLCPNAGIRPERAVDPQQARYVFYGV